MLSIYHVHSTPASLLIHVTELAEPLSMHSHLISTSQLRWFMCPSPCEAWSLALGGLPLNWTFSHFCLFICQSWKMAWREERLIVYLWL